MMPQTPATPTTRRSIGHQSLQSLLPRKNKCGLGLCLQASSGRCPKRRPCSKVSSLPETVLSVSRVSQGPWVLLGCIDIRRQYRGQYLWSILFSPVSSAPQTKHYWLSGPGVSRLPPMEKPLDSECHERLRFVSLRILTSSVASESLADSWQMLDNAVVVAVPYRERNIHAPRLRIHWCPSSDYRDLLVPCIEAV